MNVAYHECNQHAKRLYGGKKKRDLLVDIRESFGGIYHQNEAPIETHQNPFWGNIYISSDICFNKEQRAVVR